MFSSFPYVWYGIATAQQRKQLDNIVYCLKTIGCKLSHISTRPASPGFITLPSGKRLGAIKTKTFCFLNSTYCRTIKSLNSSLTLHQHLTNSKALNTAVFKSVFYYNPKHFIPILHQILLFSFIFFFFYCFFVIPNFNVFNVCVFAMCYAFLLCIVLS